MTTGTARSEVTMAEKKIGHLMTVPEIRQNPTDLVSGSASDSASDVSDWKPTKKQAAFLVALSKIGLNRNIRAVCKDADVHPSTYYEWIKDQSFLVACSEVARRIIQTAVPMTLSAMGQKAAGGDTSAARLILQTAGLVGSGGTEVHVGDLIRNQLNVHGQPPQAHGDHRDFVYRADNPEQFERLKVVADKVAAEVAACEARGEPEFTDQEHLLMIKMAAEQGDKLSAESAVIDVTPIEQGEAD